QGALRDLPNIEDKMLVLQGYHISLPSYHIIITIQFPELELLSRECIIFSMIALTPSGPRMCSQIGPCFGSKTNANSKKWQHARSKVINWTLSQEGQRTYGRIQYR